jgi:hypothetical protein
VRALKVSQAHVPTRVGRSDRRRKGKRVDTGLRHAVPGSNLPVLSWTFMTLQAKTRHREMSEMQPEQALYARCQSCIRHPVQLPNTWICHLLSHSGRAITRPDDRHEMQRDGWMNQGHVACKSQMIYTCHSRRVGELQNESSLSFPGRSALDKQ